MKKIDITGWKNVFLFTFMQTIKAKSYIISLAALCIIVAVGIPVYCRIAYGEDSETSEYRAEDESGVSNGEEDNSNIEVFNIDKVYISYEHEDKVDTLMDGIIGRCTCDIEYLEPDKVSEVSETLNDNSSTCIIKINKDDGIYSIDVVSGWDNQEIYQDMNLISDTIALELNTLQRSAVISDEYMDNAGKEVSAYVDGDETEEDAGYMTRYGLWLGYLTIMVFIVTIAGQGIGNSIITEKSSKLIEYLMVTIRPMAIVIGKVLAMLLSLSLQIAAILISAVLSVLLSGNIINIDVSSKVSNIIGSLTESRVVTGLNAGSVVLAILIILSGLIFFALVASIAGAAVSKIEESAEGMVMFTLLVIIGAYMSIALAMGHLFSQGGQLTGTYAMVCCLLPISSVFTIPANLIMGSIPAWVAVAALIILIVCAVIVLVAASKIYEYLLFYNGVTLKPGDIIHIIRYGRVKEVK